MASNPKAWTYRWTIVVFVVALCVLLTGNGNHSLWDRDEPRNSTASRNMLETGDWVSPEFNGELRAHKPILVNWTQAVSLAVFGESDKFGTEEFAVRFPSALAGAATIVLTVRIAFLLGLGVNWALLSGAMVLFSPIFLMVHKAATTDGILIAAIWWAISTHFQQSRGFCWYRHVAYGVAFGLTILQKGPVGPLVLFFFSVAWWALRRWDNEAMRTAGSAMGTPPMSRRWPMTAAISLGMCLPWLIAVSIATDGEFIRQAVGTHVIARAIGPQAIDSQSGPLWFYLPVLLALTLPFSPLYFSGIRSAWAAFRSGSSPFVGVFLWWAMATILVFSLFRTKLPHYILPILPALALTAASGLAQNTRPLPWRRFGTWFFGGMAGVLVSGSVVLVFVHSMELASARNSLIGALTVSGLIIMATGFLWWRGRILATGMALSLGMGSFVLFLFHELLPRIEPLRASRMVTGVVRDLGGSYRLGAVGYREPSLVWYHREPVEMFGRRRPWPVQEFLNADGPRAVIIEEPVYDKWARETTATLPAPIWKGRVLNLQSELLTTLLILVSESGRTTSSIVAPSIPSK